MDRRSFHKGLAAVAASAALPRAARAADYRGPNVILIRFGGGVRRAETVGDASFAPFLRHHLIPRAAFVPDMRIAQLDGVETSHAEGTLNLLTGRYLGYRRGGRFPNDWLEPVEPTLFDYLRGAFDIPAHQVLMVNGEDRPQEEFLTAGPAGHAGLDLPAEMLSLHRFKLYRATRWAEEGHPQAQAELARLAERDPRGGPVGPQSVQVAVFWARWRADHGDDGMRNPRGDRLLTALALRAMAELQPRFLMVNYQDPDYVHWGNPSHYTRAIAIIDDGLRQIAEAAERLEAYAGNTVLVVTPDCGRDANPLLGVPFQHHFNTDSARETWAVIAGPGVVRGAVLDRVADQSAVAPTIAALMGLRAHRAEGEALASILA